MNHWMKFTNKFSRKEKKMTKTYEFKVGDKVRVRDWADMERTMSKDRDGDLIVSSVPLLYGSPLVFARHMRKFCGKVGRITSIFDRGTFHLDIDGDERYYAPEVVQLVESALEKKPEPESIQSKRIAELEAEVARLKKWEDPFDVVAEKPKERIFPRVMKNQFGQLVIAESANEARTFSGVIGSEEAPSVLNWHHWSGGECPVPKDADIVICRRDRSMMLIKANLCVWSHGGPWPGSNIIAYAVIEPPKL